MQGNFLQYFAGEEVRLVVWKIRYLLLNFLDVSTVLWIFFHLYVVSFFFTASVFLVQIRLLFCLFEQKHESDGSGRVIHWPVFSLCLSAELDPPTVHEYRNKFHHLENLEFTAIHAHLLKYPEYNKVCVHFSVQMLDGYAVMSYQATAIWYKVKYLVSRELYMLLSSTTRHVSVKVKIRYAIFVCVF
jgi:hypothetical protein